MDPKRAGSVPNRQPVVFALTITTTVLTTVAVALRILARRLSAASFWYDDYMCFFSLMMSYLIDATEFAGLHYGFGFHAKDLTEFNESRYLVILYVQEAGYIFTVTAVKFSFLFFYWRLLRTRSQAFRICLLGVAAFTLAWFLSTLITIIFQCTPVNYYWNRSVPGGHCIDTNLFYIVSTALLPPLDFAILTLAVPVVWGLKMPTARQASIIFIFSLGAFISVCCIVRLTVLHEINPEDITWTNVMTGIWSNIEASIGVVCSCLPTMGPLIIRVKNKLSRPSITPFVNERNGTAPSTLRGEGFHRIDEINSAALDTSRSIPGSVHTFAHSSPTLALDEYEMKGITVTKTVDQDSANKGHLDSRFEKETARIRDTLRTV